MKVIVVGKGFISSHLNYEVVSDRINYVESADMLIEKHKPDIIVNCIGFCGGATIDGCDKERWRTFNSNVFAPADLSYECELRGIKLIHISSGCIFFGDSPNVGGWRESDATNPLSFYSKSKLAAEQAISGIGDTAILRIRMPVSWKRSPRNLLSKLIKYNQVVEAPNSITLLEDLSRAVRWAIEERKTGIYHIASEQPVLHSEILREYQKHTPEHKFTSITPEELDKIVVAPRSNCILDTSKIRKEGFEFVPQEATLAEYIRRFVQGESSAT